MTDDAGREYRAVTFAVYEKIKALMEKSRDSGVPGASYEE